jgi:L-rhamnose mutarotase
MFSIFLSMGLKPGCLDAYKKAHNNLWPEIARSMSDNGVNMAIYLENGRLYIFATAPSQAHWERSRQEPALGRWDACMAELLESSAPGKIAFQKPAKVFGFGQFAENDAAA